MGEDSGGYGWCQKSAAWREDVDSVWWVLRYGWCGAVSDGVDGMPKSVHVDWVIGSDGIVDVMGVCELSDDPL